MDEIVLASILPSYREVTYPLGLALLKTSADSHADIKRSFHISLFEARTESPTKGIVAAILRKQPAVVGFHYKACNMHKIAAVCQHLRRRHPRIGIILGGPHVHIDPATALSTTGAWCAVLGEGEETFVDLLRARMRRSPWRSIRGIAYRENGRVRVTRRRPPVQDLGLCPSPYLSRMFSSGRGSFALETARGCPNQCSYCSWENHRKPRLFPLDRVLGEVSTVLRANPRAWLYFADSSLFLVPDRARRILETIHELDPDQNASVWFHADIDHLSKDMAKLLDHRGFYCWIGVQSTNAGALQAVRRRYDPDRLVDVARMLKAMRYPVMAVQIILGLPGDDFDGFLRTLDWMYELGFPKVHVYPLQLIPGTELHRRRAEWGLKADGSPPYLVESTATFPEDQLRRAQRIVAFLALGLQRASLREAMLGTSQPASLSLRAESLMKALAAEGHEFDAAHLSREEREQYLEPYTLYSFHNEEQRHRRTSSEHKDTQEGFYKGLVLRWRLEHSRSRLAETPVGSPDIGALESVDESRQKGVNAPRRIKGRRVETSPQDPSRRLGIRKIR